MSAFVTAIWSVTLELAPWLLLGAAISGLLHVLLPANFLVRYMRGRGGVFRAVLFGVPLPLCSCGVIPAGIGLKRDGASDGASVGFLIATPQTGLDSIFVTASMLGWPFALFKLVAAAITGVVGGLWVDSHKATAPPTPQSAVSKPGKREAWDGLEHAIDVLRSIWRWLVFGIVVSALLGLLLPENAFNEMTEYSVFAMGLVALAVSVPLYVCATASVPIAAALVAGGFPPSAALVFLMAGPATNVATIGAVGRTFGRSNLIIYLTTIIAGSLLFGSLLDLTWATEVSCTHCHATDGSSIEIASSTMFLGLLVFFAGEELVSRLQRLRKPQKASDMQPIEFAVGGMTCNGCVRKLETALRTIDGVEQCAVTREPDRVRLLTNQPREVLAAAITRTGFSVLPTSQSTDTD